MQINLEMSLPAAEEAVVLGRWLITQCGGPAPGIDRMGRRLWRLQGAASFDPLMAVLKAVADAGGVATSVKQQEALEDLARAYRVK